MKNRRKQKFWNFVHALGEDTARLIISGVIDTGTGWYEDAVTPQQLRKELDACAGMDLTVEINSPGGDVFAGYEIYNMLLEREGMTRVLVTGIAASAASIIAMAADKGELMMCECSMMMVHNPWTMLAGESKELRHEADVLDLIRDTMLTAYMHRFAGSEDEMIALLDAETHLTPERAVELGLADGIAAPDAEEDGARGIAADMLSRYAALDANALREKWGVPHRTGQRPRVYTLSPLPSHDHIMSFGEIFAGVERLRKSESEPQASFESVHRDPPGPRGPKGMVGRNYLAEVDAILEAIDHPDGNIPSVF